MYENICEFSIFLSFNKQLNVNKKLNKMIVQ